MTETRKRKIAIIIDRWSTYRDIVRGRLLPRLKAEENAEFLLLTNDRCAFAEDEIEGLKPLRTRVVDFNLSGPYAKLHYSWDKACHKLSRDLLVAERPDITLAQTRRHRLKVRGKTEWAHMGYAKFLKRLGLRWHHIVGFAQRWGHYQPFADVLDEEKPDAIVYSNMMIGQSDCLREAKRRGIPIILDIPSWDQITAKGPMTVRPDFLLAWGDEMKNDAASIHSIDPQHIVTTGPLYFDTYFDRPPTWDRQTFCAKYGIDPTKKILLYTLSRIREDKCTLIFIDKILDIMRSGRLGHDCHLVVRTSPLEPLKDIKGLSGSDDVTIQTPSGHFDASGHNWLPNDDELEQRMSTILNADVMLMIQSTMVLDATFLDRPILNLAYDAGLELPWHQSVRHRFEFTHAHTYQEVGATWMVRSDAELEEALKGYLDHPGLKAENRSALIDRTTPYRDGRSYERWVQAVMDLARRG
ncbi:MAG: hypothetical protein ACPG4N_03560 [Gammaproteobacteria bacterium]